MNLRAEFNVRSLRFRLALWYFCTVGAISLLAAGGYWLTIASALNTALDQGLRYRLIGLRHFLDDVEPQGNDAIAARLKEISQIGELYQVFDSNGSLIAESYGLSRHEVPRQPPHDVDADITYDDGGTREFPLRLAWQRVTIGGRTLVICAADPQRKFEGVLRAFTSIMLVSTLVILILATAGGVWLGRRALAPIARITEEARAITETSLSSRLPVPESRDELQQLSETLNAMLGRIEQSFTRIKQFTADASHELRAPMTLIHAAAEYSLRRERSREELVAGMEKILRESRRTTTLIDDLLLLARGDAGRETLEPQSMDAAPLLRDLAEQGTVMASSKNVRVTLDLEAGVLPVSANAARLRRLLLILVDNAIKYTPPGASVVIAGRQNGATVTLSVADSGTGIAAEELPHIFERFWRADKVRARESGGTGLGLPIAQQIADQHGGRITVHSEVGRGSRFTVHLPTHVPQENVTRLSQSLDRPAPDSAL